MGSLIVIGAGFSKHAGLPLGDELFSMVIEEAKKRSLWKNIIEPDIQNYIYYLSQARGSTPSIDEINYEDFLSFLDYEHFLGLKGGDTWSNEGNRTQLAVRNLIAYVLHQCQKSIPQERYRLYERFVDYLSPGDFIYSFNYDTLLETAMESRKVSYRLFPDRFTSVHPLSATVNIDEHEVVLIKVHGSIDWFDISSFLHSEETGRQLPYLTRSRHAVFGDPSVLMPEKIVDGLYWPDSPLQNIYKINDLDEYFSRVSFLIEAPVVVAPSISKTLYLHPLREFWDGFAKVGAFNSRVGVIGFSMPTQDDYVLQPMFHLIHNFQHVTDLPTGMTKSNLKMIDFRQDKSSLEEYQNRFRFVDWTKTDTYFEGFDDESLKVLFS